MNQNNQQNIKGIIFDFDGVLCDSYTLHKNAFKFSLNYLGYDWCETKEIKYEEIKNKKTKEKLQIFSATNLVKKNDINQLNEVKQKYSISLVTNEKIDEKVKSKLPELKSKYKIGIATDANKSTVMTFLKSNSVLSYFDVIVTSQDVGGVSKPSPDIYLKALEIFNIKPEFLTVFEDTDEGCKASILSGIKNTLLCNVHNLPDLLESL